MRPPITPQTLLRKLAGAPQDDARWYIFFSLYSPLVENWIRLRGLPEALVEDALQDVRLRLARVLRDRMYDATRARFRTYMGVIVDIDFVDEAEVVDIDRDFGIIYGAQHLHDALFDFEGV